jgi:hypothetical protein
MIFNLVKVYFLVVNEEYANLKSNFRSIDAHGGERGEEGAPHVPPQNSSKSWIVKMQ